jgi:hypothetical protein
MRLEAIDQNLLSSVILTRRMRKETEVVLCAAEAGGGMCADATCSDVHVAKDVPTGKSTF